MLLSYNYRPDLLPHPAAAFAKAFGCAAAVRPYIDSQNERPWRKECAR